MWRHLGIGGIPRFMQIDFPSQMERVRAGSAPGLITGRRAGLTPLHPHRSGRWANCLRRPGRLVRGVDLSFRNGWPVAELPLQILERGGGEVEALHGFAPRAVCDLCVGARSDLVGLRRPDAFGSPIRKTWQNLVLRRVGLRKMLVILFARLQNRAGQTRCG